MLVSRSMVMVTVSELSPERGESIFADRLLMLLSVDVLSRCRRHHLRR